MISNLAFLLQVSTAGVVIGLVFFLVSAGIAFVAYKMLKKTVTMAIRMAVVAAILVIALIGSIAFLVFISSSDKTPATKPTPKTQKPR